MAPGDLAQNAQLIYELWLDTYGDGLDPDLVLGAAGVDGFDDLLVGSVMRVVFDSVKVATATLDLTL